MRRAVSLTAPAYLASAASTADLVLRLLPPHLQQQPVHASIGMALQAWQAAVGTSTAAPTGGQAKLQRAWDEPCCARLAADLLEGAVDDQARARLRASRQTTSGAWLKALSLAQWGCVWRTRQSEWRWVSVSASPSAGPTRARAEPRSMRWGHTGSPARKARAGTPGTDC